MIAGGTRYTGLDAIEWATRVEKLGAGEILLTSMDRDGTGIGFDIPLTRAVADGFTRPMAPVSAHVWGIARGQAPDADPDALRAAILAAMPGASE